MGKNREPFLQTGPCQCAHKLDYFEGRNQKLVQTRTQAGMWYVDTGSIISMQNPWKERRIQDELECNTSSSEAVHIVCRLTVRPPIYTVLSRDSLAARHS